MHFNNFFLILFLSLALFGSQSMSNCNPTAPQEPGLTNIQVEVNDINNNPVPNVKIGVFGFQEEYNAITGNVLGCLLDTFYTNSNGKREINYLTNKYNYLSVGILPDNCAASFTSVLPHQNNISLTYIPSAPLLDIHVSNLAFYDSIRIGTNPIESYCNRYDAILNVALSLDPRTITQDTQFLAQAIPNETNTLYLYKYTNEQVQLDTIIVDLENSVLDLSIE